MAQRTARVREKYNRQLRFLAVGGACFALTVALNFVLKWTVLSDKPTTAMIVATTVASVVSYLLNKTWTFDRQGKHHSVLEMFLFAVVCGVGILLNSAPVYVSRYVLGLEAPTHSFLVQEVADFVAGPVIGTAIAMVFRWWAMDRFVFPKVRKVVTGVPAGQASDGQSGDAPERVATVITLNTGEIHLPGGTDRTMGGPITESAMPATRQSRNDDGERLSA